MTAIDKYKLKAKVFKGSFFHFVKSFWDVLIKEKPVWNWHIEFLCNELQEAAERVFRGEPAKWDYIINVPPGTTKSTICSIMFPAWVLSQMPHARMICASHTENLCLDLSRKCRMIVESELYAKCFPHVVLRGDQNTKGYWMTTEGGFRFSATVGGKNPTGFHAHFLIVDDPIDPQKVFSEAEIKVANDFMNLTIANRKVDQQLSVTILVMQRLHQDDPTGNRLANKDMGPIRHICLPAEISDMVKPRRLRAKYQNGLLDPLRLPAQTLKKKKTMGEFGYAGQYRQDPVPEGGGDFKTERIKFGLPPDKFRKLVRYWDKAATDGGGARTAGVLMGIDFEDRVWILNVHKGQWSSHDREAQIKQQARIDGKRVRIGIEQEPGSGGKDSAEWTANRTLLGYRVKIDKVSADKSRRAAPFADAVGNGNVWVPESALGTWFPEYLEEMKYWPYSKYKDQIDASSGAFVTLTGAAVVIGSIRYSKT